MNCLTSAAYAVVIALLLMLSFNLSAVAGESSIQAQRLSQSRRLRKKAGPAKARIDYSQFSHSTHVDKEKPGCDSCHKFPTSNWQNVRKGDAAFPDVAEFPEHATCLDCHRQQFFARQRPAPAICSNCHVKVTPQDTARFLFPSLGDVTSSQPKRNTVSEFGINFPRDKHDEDVEISPNTHTTCFACHNVEAGITPAPSDCHVCHKLGLPRSTASHHHARGRENADQQMKVPDDADYSKFQHTSAYHARLPCLLCHRRESSAAQPTMPGGKDHAPCAGCHVKQFADQSSAICTNCHSNPPAATLKEFPRLSSFNMIFDHARHTRIICANCHRPSRGGVALTIPVGFNAHVTCFQCHGPQAKAGERDISSCGLCHQAGRHVSTSQTARAFRVGFSHQQHNRNEGLDCNDCHRVRGNVQKDVTAPQPLNHHAAARSFSCMSCHNGKRAFGGDDFSVCKRCHQGSAWHF